MQQGYCTLSISREQKRPVRLAHLDECQTDRLRGVEKTLHSEYGEISNIYMKELTSKRLLYQIFRGVFNISVQRFTLSGIHRLVDSHCARAKQFGQSAPMRRHFMYLRLPIWRRTTKQWVGSIHSYSPLTNIWMCTPLCVMNWLE